VRIALVKQGNELSRLLVVVEIAGTKGCSFQQGRLRFGAMKALLGYLAKKR
jgi:hypothetical protein